MIRIGGAFHHGCEVDAALQASGLAQRLLEKQARVNAAERRVRAAVAEHFDFIWRLLARLGVPSASLDDAAQDVFVVLSRRLADVRVGSERSFLYGTALRIASDLRRARPRALAFDARLEEVRDPGPDPEQQLAVRRRLELLDAVLEQLSDAQREVFVLFELEGMTLDECAGLLEIPRGTVASRLRSARADFLTHAKRLKLDRQGGVP